MSSEIKEGQCLKEGVVFPSFFLISMFRHLSHFAMSQVYSIGSGVGTK